MNKEIQLVKLRTNDSIYVFKNDSISNYVNTSKNYYEEKKVLGVLKSILDLELVIYDIGANIGNHSLYFSREIKAKKIYSFEPVSFIFNVLQKNAQFVNNITAFNFGLGSLEQKIQAIPRIWIDDKTSQNIVNYGSYSADNVGTEFADTTLELETAHIKVLDNLVFEEKSILPPQFIKIDVEGYELEVLKGAKKTIKTYKPVIFLESFAEKYKEVHNFLNSLGYVKKADFPEENYLYTHPKGIKINSKNLLYFNLIYKINTKYKKFEEKFKQIFKK